MSKRAIARHFCISHDSVDKIVLYSVPPGYRRTAPIERPKLDGFTEIINAWLRKDADRLFWALIKTGDSYRATTA